MNKFKASLRLFIFFGLILAAIMVPALIMSEKKEENERFPNSVDIKITEKKLSTEEGTNKIILQLDDDIYFQRLVLSPTYNYANLKKAVNQTTGVTYSYIPDGYLKNMISNFIYNYQITNTKYLSSLDKSNELFCLTKKRTKEAFEELYYSDISLYDYMDYVPGYLDYVTVRGNNYCFKYGNVDKTSDGEILIGVNNLTASKKKIITADVYVYSFYSNFSDQENTLISSIKNYISNKNFESAKKIVVNNFNGSVEHKKIVFRFNTDQKYFKYQLLYSGAIE